MVPGFLPYFENNSPLDIDRLTLVYHSISISGLYIFHAQRQEFCSVYYLSAVVYFIEGQGGGIELHGLTDFHGSVSHKMEKQNDKLLFVCFPVSRKEYTLFTSSKIVLLLNCSILHRFGNISTNSHSITSKTEKKSIIKKMKTQASLFHFKNY